MMCRFGKDKPAEVPKPGDKPADKGAAPPAKPADVKK